MNNKILNNDYYKFIIERLTRYQLVLGQCLKYSVAEHVQPGSAFQRGKLSRKCANDHSHGTLAYHFRALMAVSWPPGF